MKSSNGFEILNELFSILQQRKLAPTSSSYTSRLYEKGLDAILKKIGEEGTEVVMAAKEHSKENLIHEASDLLFHLLVLLSYENITPQEIAQELQNRNNENKQKLQSN